jgi:hypothetical protein
MNNFSQTPQFKDFEQAIDYLDSFDFKIHFLFDEFEQTSKNPNLGEPFFHALRSLYSNSGNVSYIIATRTGLGALQPTHTIISSPFFNIFTTTILEPFHADEVEELIFSYFARANRDYILAENLYAEKVFLYKMTGYHPFFLQTLCYHLCKALTLDSPPPEWPRGQVQEKALQGFEEDSRSNFEQYWQVSLKKEKELIKELADKQFMSWDSLETMGPVKNLKDRCLLVPSEEVESKWSLFSLAFGKWVKIRSVRILLADDSEDWRKILGGLLEDQGYEVVTEASKEKVTQRIKK